MSRISKLSFSLEPCARDESLLSIEPLIDGTPLVQLIQIFEKEHCFARPGKYAGIIPQHFNIGPLDRYFMGDHGPESLWAEGIELLSCTCGEFGCWPLIARVVVEENLIRWCDFRQPHRPKQDYAEFGSIIFDADQYRHVVGDLESQFLGWARTTGAELERRKLDPALAQLESNLAARLRECLDAVAAKGEPRSLDLRDLCSVIEYLLQYFLTRRPIPLPAACQGSSWWVDGILPDAVKLISPAGIQIRGKAIWSTAAPGPHDPFWIEPFFATIRRATGDSARARYTLQFGDSERGLATTLLSKHLRRIDWFYPTGYMYTFTNESALDR